MTDDVLRVAALLVACLLGLWTAVACRRAHDHGLPGSDALVWASLSAVFFLLSLMKTVRGLGLLRGFGGYLRDIFKQRGWYEDRRTLQITASIAVAVVIMVLFVWGLLWAWHFIKRYRLAVGFAGLIVGFAIIRFISLHEVDAWNAGAPWARTVVDLVAAAGVSAVAIARLRQLSDYASLRHRT
jgi:small-conductance mechanosensitive channel